MRKQPMNILLSLTLLFAAFLSGFYIGRSYSTSPVQVSNLYFEIETTAPVQTSNLYFGDETTAPAQDQIAAVPTETEEPTVITELPEPEPETQVYVEPTEAPTHPPATEASSKPTVPAETKASTTPKETKSADASAGLININTASAAELETLPGIGEVIAQRIVDYRNTYGPFTSVSALINVKGIGEKRLAGIINLVTI